MDFAAARAGLILHLRHDINDERVLAALGRVPREEFVLEGNRHAAYENRALSIGLGQTISQPLIVAMMTEALELNGKERVLEVGTGSGYQTAILAEMAGWVVSVERHPQLVADAQEVLERLGYTNFEIFLAEETLGWPRGAPYDAAIVTAASPRVPEQLLGQLVPGGRLVIPVGSRHEQDLLQVTVFRDRIVSRNLGGCRFVSLIGEGAWDEEER